MLKEFVANAKKTWISILTTMGAIVVGILGSVKSHEINQAFPFYWGEYEGYSWPAIIFWILLLFVTFGYIVVAHGSHGRRIKNEEKLIAQAEDIKRTLGSMPPNGFLETFNFLFEKVYVSTRLCIEECSKENSAETEVESIEKTIRSILNVVLSLCREFDDNLKNPVLSINIMLPVKSNNCTEEQIKMLDSNMMFEDRKATMKNMLGALVLMPKLSVRAVPTETSAINVDLQQVAPDNIEFVVMGLPDIDIDNNEEFFKAIPGASRAFYNEKPQGYKDIDEMLVECHDQEKTNLNGAETKEIIKYFDKGAGKDIESFMSVSFRINDGDINGVLNIHSSAKGLLGQDERVVSFFQVIRPFMLLLSELLIELHVINSEYWFEQLKCSNMATRDGESPTDV